MATPRVYYTTQTQLEIIKAIAFKLLMSGEVRSVDSGYAGMLFDYVGDMTEGEANETLDMLDDDK